jgi:hypothetical protein
LSRANLFCALSSSAAAPRPRPRRHRRCRILPCTDASPAGASPSLAQPSLSVSLESASALGSASALESASTVESTSAVESASALESAATFESAPAFDSVSAFESGSAFEFLTDRDGRRLSGLPLAIFDRLLLAGRDLSCALGRFGIGIVDVESIGSRETHLPEARERRGSWATLRAFWRRQPREGPAARPHGQARAAGLLRAARAMGREAGWLRAARAAGRPHATGTGGLRATRQLFATGWGTPPTGAATTKTMASTWATG